MHNRMKEALVLLGKLAAEEIERIRAALHLAGLLDPAAGLLGDKKPQRRVA